MDEDGPGRNKKARVDLDDSWDDDDIQVFDGPDARDQAVKASQAFQASQAVQSQRPTTSAANTPKPPSTVTASPFNRPSAAVTPKVVLTSNEAVKLNFQLQNTQRERDKLARQLANATYDNQQKMKEMEEKNAKETRALKSKLQEAQNEIQSISFRNTVHTEAMETSVRVDANESIRSTSLLQTMKPRPMNSNWMPPDGFRMDIKPVFSHRPPTSTADTIKADTSAFHDVPSQAFASPVSRSTRASAVQAVSPSIPKEQVDIRLQTESEESPVGGALQQPMVEVALKAILACPRPQTEWDDLTASLARPGDSNLIENLVEDAHLKSSP